MTEAGNCPKKALQSNSLQLTASSLEAMPENATPGHTLYV